MESVPITFSNVTEMAEAPKEDERTSIRAVELNENGKHTQGETADGVLSSIFRWHPMCGSKRIPSYNKSRQTSEPKSTQVSYKPKGTKRSSKPKSTKRFLKSKSTKRSCKRKSTKRFCKPKSTRAPCEPQSSKRSCKPVRKKVRCAKMIPKKAKLRRTKRKSCSKQRHKARVQPRKVTSVAFMHFMRRYRERHNNLEREQQIVGGAKAWTRLDRSSKQYFEEMGRAYQRNERKKFKCM